MTSESNIDYENIFIRLLFPHPFEDFLTTDHAALNRQLNQVLELSSPFGARTVVGFVMSKTFESTIPLSKLKLIIEILDEEPILPQEILSILKWSSDYYHHPIGQVLSTAVPKKNTRP